MQFFKLPLQVTGLPLEDPIYVSHGILSSLVVNVFCDFNKHIHGPWCLADASICPPQDPWPHLWCNKKTNGVQPTKPAGSRGCICHNTGKFMFLSNVVLHTSWPHVDTTIYTPPHNLIILKSFTKKLLTKDCKHQYNRSLEQQNNGKSELEILTTFMDEESGTRI